MIAKAEDLKTAFLTDDATTICLEILEKGDLQVAGKEREAQLSLQFRDIATIVMENTINPDTKRPYSITMIERLMHDIHFVVDPHNSSKKQALDVIHRLVKKFPIKRSPMRLRLTVGEQNFSTVLEKLGTWNGEIVTMDESGTQFSVVCEVNPGLYRQCNWLVRDLQGTLELVAPSVHAGEAALSSEDNQTPRRYNLPVVLYFFTSGGWDGPRGEPTHGNYPLWPEYGWPPYTDASGPDVDPTYNFTRFTDDAARAHRLERDEYWRIHDAKGKGHAPGPLLRVHSISPPS
ncbi:uncharacterized protein [Spinacia oleracea]|uniref:Uncharacterized protein n=1 Tax=Spinacia oleracea TaxID=3562 RepID=A0A9R0JVT1_SPIOL|nr:uncharacterized protein LOC110788551 [Spinacia oleracea]